MTIEKKLLGTNPVSGEVLPEAVSFDGTTDSLSRTTPMTGQADGKTFTLSLWVYWLGTSGNAHLFEQGGGRFYSSIQDGNNRLKIRAKNASGTEIFRFETPINNVPDNTWVSIQMSFDLSDTSKRHIYVNEVDITSATFAGTYPKYVNDNIDLTPAAGSGLFDTTYRIAAQYSSQGNINGRLAHFFFDYTYRDLSVTSNRRLFIDADGKPADTDTLAALNPILYLPMTDAATAGSNSGTGGDFTVNGVLATAERGPNQDNCSASNFATAADTLLRSDNQGWVATKTITCSFTVDTLSSNNNIYGAFAPSERVKIKITSDDTYADSSTLSATFNSAANGNDSVRFILTNDLFMRNKHSHITFSFDASDTSKRHLYVNGEAVSANWLDFNNTNLQMNNVTKQYINSTNSSGDNGTNTNIGEFYMANAYYDLATDNPFWDSDANRPNSVRKVIADTSVTPLIALPIMGNDAGNNLGSGGDFTVNSGPFVGARGGSEFWARSADFSSTNHLSKSSSWGNSSNYTFAVAFRPHNTSGFKNLFVANDPHAAQYGLRISQDDAKIEVQQKNTSNANFVNAAFSGLVANTWYVFLASFSVGASKFSMEIRGGVTNSYSTTSLSNTGQVRLQGTTKIGGGAYGNFDGDIGFVYLSKGYVDISQESNRNKFVDQLGYPKDLTPLIDAGDIPSPVVYMKLDPSVSLGTNSGTGGDFTVSGTLVAGPDVDP